MIIHHKHRTFKYKVLFIILPILMASLAIYSKTTAQLYTIDNLQDGDIVKEAYDNDVYILKILPNGKLYRRVILNPSIFESYAHLKWEDIKIVEQSTLNKFSISNQVREVYPDGTVVNGRVYMLFPKGDEGTKRHIKLSQEEFLEAGGDPDSIYNINHLEASEFFYVEEINITNSLEYKNLLIQYGSIKTPTDLNLVPLPAPPPKEDTDKRSTADIHFAKRTLSTPYLLPSTRNLIMIVDINVSRKDIKIEEMDISLHPVQGGDMRLEPTFSKIEIVEHNKVIAEKYISSPDDYYSILNSAIVKFDNLDINLQENASKAFGIYLTTNKNISAQNYRDWNIVINQNAIRAKDDISQNYYNNTPLIDTFEVRSRINRDEPVQLKKVSGFNASSVTANSISLGWNEYADGDGYKIEKCSGIEL